MCFSHSTIVGDYSAVVHLFSFRTQKLRPVAVKILVGKPTGKIARCQHFIKQSIRSVFLSLYINVLKKQFIKNKRNNFYINKRIKLN